MHWLDRAVEAIEAPTYDLKALAALYQDDITSFYANTVMHDVNVEGQDLSGLAFAGYDFETVQMDFETRIPGYLVELETTQGLSKIALRPDLAPNHVEHIRTLIGEGFYDNVVFHRVIDGFMAQTGCPNGTGTGGSKYPNLKQEFNAEPHVRGICSMARAQNPDSANSQFFICFGDSAFLNNQYSVFGKVVSGMKNIDRLKRGEPVRDPDRIILARLV